MDIVSGATVTLMVIGDSITRSAIAVARAHGVGKAARPAQAATARVQARTVDETPGEVRSWQALLDNGAVRQLRLSVADVNQAFRASGRDDAAAHAESRDEADAFIELYVAQVSAPAIGRSLLGETGWLRLKERLKPGSRRCWWRAAACIRSRAPAMCAAASSTASKSSSTTPASASATATTSAWRTSPPRARRRCARWRCSWCRKTPRSIRWRHGACNSWCSACSASRTRPS